MLFEDAGAWLADAQNRKPTDGTQRGDPLTTGLPLVVVAALSRLLDIGIARLRRMHEDAAARRRIELIAQLRGLGYLRQVPEIFEELSPTRLSAKADSQRSAARCHANRAKSLGPWDSPLAPTACSPRSAGVCGRAGWMSTRQRTLGARPAVALRRRRAARTRDFSPSSDRSPWGRM